MLVYVIKQTFHTFFATFSKIRTRNSVIEGKFQRDSLLFHYKIHRFEMSLFTMQKQSSRKKLITVYLTDTARLNFEQKAGTYTKIINNENTIPFSTGYSVFHAIILNKDNKTIYNGHNVSSSNENTR